MGGPDGPVFRWHEPSARPGTVVLLGTAAAGLLALAAVSVVVSNWDVAVLSAALGLAAAADLWRDLRPRAFVMAGEDGLVVSTVAGVVTGARRRTTVLAWTAVADIRVEEGRFRRSRALVERVGGGVVPLPREAPVDELRRRWPRG